MPVLNDLPVQVVFRTSDALPSSVHIVYRDEERLQHILQHAEIDSSQYSLEHYPQELHQRQLQNHDTDNPPPRHQHHHGPTNMTGTRTNNVSSRISMANTSSPEGESQRVVVGSQSQTLLPVRESWCPLTRHLLRALHRRQQQQQQNQHDDGRDNASDADNVDVGEFLHQQQHQLMPTTKKPRRTTRQFKKPNRGDRTGETTASVPPPPTSYPSSPLDIHPAQVAQNMIRTYKANLQQQQPVTAVARSDPIAMINPIVEISTQAPVTSEVRDAKSPWDIHPRKEVINMIRTYQEEQRRHPNKPEKHEGPTPRQRKEQIVPAITANPKYGTPQHIPAPLDFDDSNQETLVKMIRLYKEQELEHNRYQKLQEEQEEHLRKLQQYQLRKLQEHQLQKLQQLQLQELLQNQFSQSKPPPTDESMLKTFTPQKKATKEQLETKVDDAIATFYVKRREPINKKSHRRSLVDNDESQLHPPKQKYPQQQSLAHAQLEQGSSQGISSSWSSSSSSLALPMLQGKTEVSQNHLKMEQPDVYTRKSGGSATLTPMDDYSNHTVPAANNNAKPFVLPTLTTATTTPTTSTATRSIFPTKQYNLEKPSAAANDDLYDLWKRPRTAPTEGLEVQQEDIPMLLQLFPTNRHSYVERLMEQGHSIQSIFVTLSNEEKKQQQQYK